jgi:hypothetical protein
MMKFRSAWLALAIALVGAFVLAPVSGVAARGNNLLKNVPVTGTLADGGTFRGKLTITGMGYNEAGSNQGLTVSGVVQGVATTADGTQRHVKQAFTDVRATLNERGSAGGMSTQQAVCDILFLNLGPLHLDLLGLTVDLSEITLDINAVPGAGNLLGNLLCAIAGLLDPGGLLDGLLGQIGQLLEQLLGLLDQVNQLL